ncbi:SMI1/KNR4 family protein [Cardiobacterium valvarum]|uniref:Knr4/Smi1-like domain-containing protein n=1 Tax=Cardiobacterium valvarum TaxID=194702 RepID=A0A381E1R1_9GAMM|nr:SMI1/KNR4 family protein [Cardiobacterium valvarum]SUX20000.1 Uncharacterised protein [Cardiobacterium valvarum]
MTTACPAALRDFLNARIGQDGALCGSLPEVYADADALDAFQDGYKDDEYDGTAGYLKPSQYVICTNDFADPFIIDLDEAAVGYPVAFAYHGQGSWQPFPVAASLAAFTDTLRHLAACRDDPAQAAAYIEQHCAVDNPYWQEVCAELREAAETATEKEDEPHYDPYDWERGSLVITAIGSNPTAVRQWLAHYLNLSPAAALALSRAAEITCDDNIARKFAAPLLAALTKRGATAVFRPHHPSPGDNPHE